jgi:Bacterial SH3 domain
MPVQAKKQPLTELATLAVSETSGSKNGRRKIVRRTGAVVAGVAVASTLAVGSALPASAAGTYRTTASVNVRSGPGTQYGVVGGVASGTAFTLLCQWQGGTNVGGNSTWDRVTFSNGLTGAITDFDTTTPSFNNYAPGTGDCNATPPGVSPQMQNAANWAVAEARSPDPTWSDHFGHAWSGYCEEFAEQAEGFTFRFSSALTDYQWQAAHGRIHTDSNPPVGALVYYGAGGGFGHVAVSIGNGQEIGTYGYAGQRLAVRQYPVRGFLSNPYYGWANPIGS